MPHIMKPYVFLPHNNDHGVCKSIFFVHHSIWHMKAGIKPVVTGTPQPSIAGNLVLLILIKMSIVLVVSDDEGNGMSKKMLGKKLYLRFSSFVFTRKSFNVYLGE